MGREIKRVVAGFDWPLNKVWEGFLTPEWLHQDSCPNCESGYSREAQAFFDQWYGYAPFDPATTGCEPLTTDTPAVRAFAQRNVDNSPSFYGSGVDAVLRESERLLRLWNAQWCHHLSQDDVDALVEGGRLWDFTREFVPGEGWRDRATPYTPTAAEVNVWSLTGFGHDAINASVVIRARCEREAVPLLCDACGGSGSSEKFKGQAKLAEKWKPIKPPKGDWWQLWETVSEGSPVTPAFATPEDLASHMTTDEPESYQGTLAWITGQGWSPSGIVSGGLVQTADQIIASGGLS